MGKNKQKNNSNNNRPGKATVVTATNQLKPTIVVKPSNEILTTEEGEQLLQSSLEEMEKYCKTQCEAADKYYEEKQKLADGLETKKQEEIDREVARAVKEKEREMKQDIDSAKREAKQILEDAKKDAKQIVDEAKKEAQEELNGFDEREGKIEEREEQLNADYEKYTKQVAELEASKINYKREMLDSIKSDMELITQEKTRLEKNIEDLKHSSQKKDSDIASLEADIAYYEELMSVDATKKAEILSYKAQIEQLTATCQKLETICKERQDRIIALSSQIVLYGDDPQQILRDNEELKEKNAELQSVVANCPSAEELSNLRETNNKFEELSNKLECANDDIRRLESENNDLKVSKDEIESYRKFIKILELQKSELQKELDRNIELYKNKTEKIFANLSLIDNMPCNEYPSMRSKITLRSLCERFRGYLANRKTTPLFYEEKTIRTFIAGFASSKLMILEGLSGTGKSSLPRAFADFMGSKTIEVPVQSSWKDRNDLLGFYNEFKRQYKETEFLKALYTATHDRKNIYVIVLDEMNLSRIEYYFADLLSVLEKPNVEDWKIELISDYASISQNKESWPKLIHEGKLQICDNTWFVGTANKDDSVQTITDKVYDRAVALKFDKKGTKCDIANSSPIQMNNEDFQILLRNASKFKNPTDESKFYSMIEDLDKQVKDKFKITFGNRVSNQLETFVPVYIECGGAVEEAIDVMFSRKIIRKLEGVYDEDIKKKLNELEEYILSKYDMPNTSAAIEEILN